MTFFCFLCNLSRYYGGCSKLNSKPLHSNNNFTYYLVVARQLRGNMALFSFFIFRSTSASTENLKRVFLLFLWHFGPYLGHDLPLRGFAITTIVLHELSAWLRTWQHNTQKRQISMLPVKFEPAFPASERPQNHVLDKAATGIGLKEYRNLKIQRNRNDVYVDPTS